MTHKFSLLGHGETKSTDYIPSLLSQLETHHNLDFFPRSNRRSGFANVPVLYLIIFIYLFIYLGRERDFLILLVHCPSVCKAEAESWKIIRVFHMGARWQGPNCLSPHLLPPRVYILKVLES